MKKYGYIATGGALGAILRFAIKDIHMWSNRWNFPFDTLLINICGSFILALFLTFALEVMDMDADIRLGVSTGFIGAFTTFSTLCKETVLLIFAGSYLPAISYVGVSVLLGFSAAYSGVVLARKLIFKLTEENDYQETYDIDDDEREA